MTINREKVIEEIKDLKEKGHVVPHEDMITAKEQIEKIKEVTTTITELLDLIEKNIKPGITTEEINNIAHDFIISQWAVPGFLGTQNHLTGQKYTKIITISINNEVFLGVLSHDRVLKDGDIVNVCIPIRYNEYSSNVSRMFVVENVSYFS